MRLRDKTLDEFIKQRSEKVTDFHFKSDTEKKEQLISFMKDDDLRPYNQNID